MGQKLFNRIKGLRHREKPMAEKGAEGGFSTMLAYQIIKKRGFIEILFAIGCLFSLLAMLFVDVNYDLTKYVPKSAVSAQGLGRCSRYAERKQRYGHCQHKDQCQRAGVENLFHA